MSENEDFWGKPEKQRRKEEKKRLAEKRKKLQGSPKPAKGNKKPVASKPADSTWLEQQAAPTTKRTMPKWAKLSIYAVILLFVVGIFIAILGPTLAAPIVRSKLEAKISSQIQGHAEISSATLSWRGQQTLKSVKLIDARNNVVARLDLTITKGIVPLVLGSKDLGTITISGWAKAKTNPDGSNTLAMALKPSTSNTSSTKSTKTPAKASRIPEGLKAKIMLNDLQLSFEDQSAPGKTLSIEKLTGTIKLEPAGTAIVDITAQTVVADTPASDQGDVTLKVVLSSMLAPGRNLQLNKTRVEGSLTLNNIPTTLADTLLGMNQKLGSILGQRTSLQVNIQGTLDQADASLSFKSPHATAKLKLRSNGSTIRLPEPAIASLDSQASRALLPIIKQLTSPESGFTLTNEPGITLQLNRLNLSIPQDGKAWDFKDAAIAFSIDLDAIDASFKSPRQTTASDARLTTEPIRMFVTSDRLSEGVQGRLWTSVTINDSKAGSLDITLNATDLLDNQGVPHQTGPGKAQVTLTLDKLAAQVVQPFVTQAGIDWEKEVGSSLTTTLNAELIEPLASGDLPDDGQLLINVKASNLNAQGTLNLQDGVLTQSSDKLTLTIKSIGPTMNRLSQGRTRITKGGAATLAFSKLSANLNQIISQPLDLSSLSTAFTLSLTNMTGQLDMGDGTTQQLKPFTAEDAQLVVNATSLLQKITIQGSMLTTVQDASTGDATIDLTLTDLLTPIGSLSKEPTIRGSTKLTGFASSLLHPFLAPMGLDPSIDFGPTVSLQLDAIPAPQNQSTQLDLKVASERFDITGKLRIEDQALTTTTKGLTLRVIQAGPLFQRLVADRFNLKAGKFGNTSVTLNDLLLPLSAMGDISQASLSLNFSGGNYSLTNKAADATTEPLNITSFNVAAALRPGKPAQIKIDSQLAHAGHPFAVTGQLVIDNLFSSATNADTKNKPSFDLSHASPTGSVAITDIPATLIILAARSSSDMDTDALAQALTELLGTDVSITLKAQAATSNSSKISLAFASEKLNTAIYTTLTDSRLTSMPLSIKIPITPQAVDALTRAFQPGSDQRLALQSKTALNLKLSKASFDFSTGDRVSPEASLTLANKAIFKLPQNQHAVGLSNLKVTGRLPPATSTNGSLVTTIIDEDAQPIAQIQGSFKRTALSSPPTGSLKISKVDIQAFDDALANHGALVSMLGSSGNINLTITPDGANKTSALSATIRTDRLQTTQKITGTLQPDRFTLSEPVDIAWNVNPVDASRLAFGNKTRAARFEGELAASITIDRFAIGLGDLGLLHPSVFDLDATANIPNLSIVGSDNLSSRYQQVKAHLAKGQDAGLITLSADLPSATTPGTDDGKLRLKLSNLANEKGTLTLDQAVVDVDLTLPEVSSAIPDALTTRDGLTVDLLGPTLSVGFKAQSLSSTSDSGLIQAGLVSPRATAALAGHIISRTSDPSHPRPVFVAQGPVDIQFNEITPELAARFIPVMPLLGRVEKRLDDTPAQLQATGPDGAGGITLPMAKNNEDLHGDVVLNLSGIRFEQSAAFSDIIKSDENQVYETNSIERLLIRFRDGVATYDRVKIPVGDWVFQSQGVRIDLVTGKYEVITWAPLESLSQNALNDILGGLTSTIGKAIGLDKGANPLTMIPIRTTGTIGGKSSTKPAMDIIVNENILGTVFKPVDLLEKLGKNVLDQLFGPGKK